MFNVGDTVRVREDSGWGPDLQGQVGVVVEPVRPEDASWVNVLIEGHSTYLPDELGGDAWAMLPNELDLVEAA